MHTWTVTCDPATLHESGTTATEVAAVHAGTEAMRRLVRATRRPGHQVTFVNLVIDARPRLGITAAPGSVETALERLDRYEHEATLAAAVDDSILARLHLEPETTADIYADEGAGAPLMNSHYQRGHAAGYAAAVERAHHGDATADDAEQGQLWLTTEPGQCLDEAAAAEYERGFCDGWAEYLTAQR
ncbi:hypothetical protein QM787_22260 [Rhodococcus ruber]|uniref:Uncharacterized protein n=1 Tax=Rhodococcus ruber TaxID=1830 RepID=A0A098BH14_9NOCA|nr:hypothetical protein [Rhodococcus ruber]ETT25803.1 hypothetical protein RR21198_3548 [Rhodococcus rhodochrous ATCC 21198]MCD2129540.1 hypothetical protein [Rhodococcus ruber]MCZ4505416.1 hypothetical protein [Rhodococcus ruber]MCZ4532847.1 hypothetical protein [Rhodococcus ruber]MCZ4532886.1 hypothetical protein [Rhodococcus ruber]